MKHALQRMSYKKLSVRQIAVPSAHFPARSGFRLVTNRAIPRREMYSLLNYNENVVSWFKFNAGGERGNTVNCASLNAVL